jgi:hypothetical protein
MATTYKLISSVTVGSGGAASMEFTSIPATYTDILIKVSARTNRASIADSVIGSFNGSSANFSWRLLEGDAVSGYSANGTTGLVGVATASTATANTFSSFEFYIPNYSGSSYKSINVDSVTENNVGPDVYADFNALLWSNSAAITSITLSPSIGTLFSQYSTAYLYGISNA